MDLKQKQKTGYTLVDQISLPAEYIDIVVGWPESSVSEYVVQ